MSASSTLKQQLLGIGIGSIYHFNGQPFCFSSGGYEITGIVTGTRNSDDGLPVIEVSNKWFAGFQIEDILLMDSYGKAQLTTTETNPAYRYYIGEIKFPGVRGADAASHP